jgi:nucleotide-binding universal stress UspA family protein
MSHSLSRILCPIDFSEPSRAALRYAAAIASHTSAALTLLTVNDPLLAEAAEMASGTGRLAADAKAELEKFYRDSLPGSARRPAAELVVATGPSAAEILRHAKEGSTDLLVMSSHGATGIRKLFFGSTTERVLRETSVPVLVVPRGDGGPETLAELKKVVRRILVPVDLSAAIEDQVSVASQLADTLDASLLLVHIIEPVRAVVPGHDYAANVDSERRGRAEQRLQALIATLPAARRPEALVMFGEPAEEISKIASDRAVGLIVMGLHASILLGPRMGSVTYRVLCVTEAIVLALPPGVPAAGSG